MSALPRVDIGGGGWLHVRPQITDGTDGSTHQVRCHHRLGAVAERRTRLIPWWINHIPLKDAYSFMLYIYYILCIYIIVIMACRSYGFVEFYLLPEHPSIVAPTCHSTSRRSNMGGSEWCAGSGVTNLAASLWGALSDSGLSRKCETC